VLTGGEKVRLWDVETGTLLRAFVDDDYIVEYVAFSQDGHDAITINASGQMNITDAATGARKRTVQHAGNVHAAAMSKDRSRALTSGDRGVELWDATTGTVLRLLTSDEMHAVAMTPRASVAVVGASDGTLAIWDLTDASAPARTKKLGKLEPGKIAFGHSIVAAVAVSSDGRFVAALEDEFADPRAVVHVWELASDREILLAAHAHDFHAGHVLVQGAGLAFTPDNSRIVVLDGIEEVARVWDLHAQTALQTVATKSLAAAVSEDGQHLVTGDEDPIVWDLVSGHAERRLVSQFPWVAVGMAFSNDGRRLVCSIAGHQLVTWDLSTLGVERFVEPTFYVKELRALADGRWLATSDDKPTLAILDLETGRPITRFSDATHDCEYETCRSQLGDDARVELVETPNGIVEFYDTMSTTMRGRIGTTDHVTSMPSTLSTDGARVLTAGALGVVELWDLTHERWIRTLGRFDRGIATLRWSRDGRYGVVGLHGRRNPNGPKPTTDFSLHVLSIERDAPPRAIDTGTMFDRLGISEAWFVDKDAHLLVRSMDRIALFDVASGRQLREYVHTSGIERVALSPDERLAAVAYRDGTVRLWRLDNGTSVALMASGDRWIVVADDGTFDASRTGGDLMAAVVGITPYRVDQLGTRNNRPDRLLERMGLGDRATTSYFRARHERRIAKLGLVESKLAASFARAPTASMVATADGKYANVTLELDAHGAALRRYNVFVNGVPLHGPDGARTSGQHQRFTERVELAIGRNRIEVAAYDTGGAESFHPNRVLTYNDPWGNRQGDLYFVGFGISRYRDPSYRLHYAHKDVLDLGAVMSMMKGTAFRDVHIATFVDERATVASIHEARALLAHANVDDTIVLFVAGHGIHDRDSAAEYYFATYETDIADLRRTAASFELVESLLQDTKARRKLFLMDTCESGERDPNEERRTLTVAGQRGLTSRGFTRVERRTLRGATREFLASRDRLITTDPVLRSGAVVISSSRGAEQSYELDELQNGVFTEQLMIALTSSGDEDSNVLSATDLVRRIAPGVAKLTGGLQHPTIDRDNLDATIVLPLVPRARPIVVR
jgi:WD40 repeat protein